MLLAALLCSACRTSAPVVETPPPPVSPSKSDSPPVVHRFTDNWSWGAGCTPMGEELTLEGVLIVRPFGKGTDGAVLKTGAGDWVLAYRAEGALLELRDKRVVARGRECVKQGEAIYGRHFDLATLAEATQLGAP